MDPTTQPFYLDTLRSFDLTTQSVDYPMEDRSILSSPDNGSPFAGDSEARDLASLRILLDQLPYACETTEQMDTKLQEIVGKQLICARTKYWHGLASWDGLLQCWLLLRYPIPKATRAELTSFYYELALLPGVESSLVRGWVDMLTRLLPNKPGHPRKLEITDLKLSWKPLWLALRKELWPRTRLQDDQRNMVNILLYLAEHCKHHFPPSEIPAMLDEMVPLITKENILTMIPVMTSFMPPTHTHFYLPLFLQLWKGFNSNVIDDRLIELLGEVAEKHVSGQAGSAGHDGGAPWKEVGIFTIDEWHFIVSKALGSMHVPVGASKSGGAAAAFADLADGQSTRIKKNINRYLALAKIFVYSMSQDSPVRVDDSKGRTTEGCLAGSKAMDSLEKLIMGTETFFHPSNSGPWSIALASFVQNLSSEFGKRYHEEEQAACVTPSNQRLTPAIRQAFVSVLRTPCLLAMFAKDAVSSLCAQSALRSLAFLEPKMIMPELLERAYDGLEAVNETHRTTAVLSVLTGVVRPLVTESIWLGGQKHVVPLLMCTLAGIDLNDPAKTICATRFITGIVQQIKIGNLSGKPLVLDDTTMEVDDNYPSIPDGVEAGVTPELSKNEERALAWDTTANFADWVTSLFRQVFRLYENLPEEGGRRNTTGGKQEETVLQNIKGMLDVTCLHLSDSLFDLVLKLVFDYATSNAKANSVRAFGQLIGSLARVRPEKTMERFLPFCISQIEEELKYGASSTRTTSAHAAIPSDTTLHWNLAILRGCWGYGGSTLVKRKTEILHLISLLVDKTRSERGYSSTGRLITRVAHTLSSIYPLNSLFVNTDIWKGEEFNNNHLRSWGQQYEAKDVKLEWHIPSAEEIDLVLEILDKIVSPALDKVEEVLITATWDEAARNDFCRFLHVARSVWSGLSTFILEQEKDSPNPCIYEDTESARLSVAKLDVDSAFVLTDPNDPRFKAAHQHRLRFGQVIQRAASILSQAQGEDHIDPIIAVLKGIDVYLLEYGMSRGTFESFRKSYRQARDVNRIWYNDKHNSRLVFAKRAQVYHYGRVYVQTLYRTRSALDDALLRELTEASLSHYTRVRRYSQAILHNTSSYYVRTTRFILPEALKAIHTEIKPDRKKGALYILANKAMAGTALSEYHYTEYLTTLLGCQNEEKPSIQKLVNDLSSDCLPHLQEEFINTAAYLPEIAPLAVVLDRLESIFPIDKDLLAEIEAKQLRVLDKRTALHENAVRSILELADRPGTHWRYVLNAAKFLGHLCRRDVPSSPDMMRFFIQNTLNPQPSIRKIVQRALCKSLTFVKLRTFTTTPTELWSEETKNPLHTWIKFTSEGQILRDISNPIDQTNGVLVDKITTGFLTWSKTIKGYAPVIGTDYPFSWENASEPTLKAVHEVLSQETFFLQLGELWGQESSVEVSTLDLRARNIDLIKSLVKTYPDIWRFILSATDPLLDDSDKFKQRAGVELLAGLLRGIKHYPPAETAQVWDWTIQRLNKVFPQIKPDTMSIWEYLFSLQLVNRDPERNRPLVDWILSRPLEFQGDSAFEMVKTASIFGILVDSLGIRFSPMSASYTPLLFRSLNTTYAEVRGHISHILSFVVRNAWRPAYSSTHALLDACVTTSDPLKICHATYHDEVSGVLDDLARWREERLPPPRVTQSEYDRRGLALLTWIWLLAYSPQACLVFPYTVVLMPEILRMTNIQDNPELQALSSGVLYVLSSVATPQQYVGVILDHLVEAITTSNSWRTRRYALPVVLAFYFRNLLVVPPETMAKLTKVLVECLRDDNIEVREMAAKVLSGVVRCSQRNKILSLKALFLESANKTVLPSRRDPGYADALRELHSSILGLCSLIESFPYSPVEPWMPSLTEVLANHSTDPPPISTAIRKCASEFKKTHQDTWHKDQLAFDEDQLQNLSSMLVGTSYYA